MSSLYDPSTVEPKWQKRWEKAHVYDVDLKKGKDPYYCLVMFPYPSGARLHVGHWYQYGPTDSYARFLKMRGHDVFFPMGFDAFGLPAENYAVKTGIHPAKSTEENVQNMIGQFRRMGCMYDWGKSLDTSKPDYYRWTQWLFLQMFKHGLAYKKEAPVNFCPGCQTVLAHEQCQDGHCERCETEVIQKPLTQWFWKITDYAQRLLDGLEDLDWPEKTKTMQRNWIGRSAGAEIEFQVMSHESRLKITVFTTRPDTLFGATYMVLAPEHPLVDAITPKDHQGAVHAYREEVKKKTELERTDLAKEKTGVPTGAYAVNPVNGEQIPIWIADYVLLSYGTGAVMAVPAHDERDFEFAKKYKLPIREVVRPVSVSSRAETRDEPSLPHAVLPFVSAQGDTAAFTADGISINSEFLNGLPTPEAKKRMIAWLEDKGCGREHIQYRLRDWLVSRQRYWGAPIPVVYDPEGSPHPVPEEHLPWFLPTDVEFKPTGKSPLFYSKEFKERTEKIFGKGWTPECDTMDTFVDSSFYYLRFLMQNVSSRNFQFPISNFQENHKSQSTNHEQENTHYSLLTTHSLVDHHLERTWMPVRTYIGGAEHACMHLIYARFVMMTLHDFGFVSHEEPFKKLVHQGMITNKGAKMSKSKGNVVDPDPFVSKYGSDVFRMYLMFMGPYTDGGDWSDTGIKGIERFVQRIWKLFGKGNQRIQGTVQALMHRTIKKVTEDMERLHFNTAVSALMEFLNTVEESFVGEEYSSPTNDGQSDTWLEISQTFIKLLAPLAPHLAEELWEKLSLCHPERSRRVDTGAADVMDSSLVSARDDTMLTMTHRQRDFVFHQPWPTYDPKFLQEETVTIVIQVNGKVRGSIEVPAKSSKDDVLAKAKDVANVKKYVEGKKIQQEVYIPDRLVNFVV